MSRIIIAITDGHRAVYNAWRRTVYLPTCTCYLYAVKFISRLGHRPPWVLPAALYTWPCLYAPNTRDEREERVRKKVAGESERVANGAQIEHEPHLLPGESKGRKQNSARG